MSSFSPSELSLSLKEELSQDLISGYDLVPCPEGEDRAEAVVRIVDRILRIQLTPRGFTCEQEQGSGQHHETLQDLLRCESPAYAQAWSDKLMEKLFQLEGLRSDDGREDKENA